MGIAAVTLVAVCGVFLTLLWQSEVKQTAAERQARMNAEERATAEEEAWRSATRRLTESEIDLHMALCEQGEVARGLDGLKGVLGREDWPPELARLIRSNMGGWRCRHPTLLADLPFDKVVNHVALTPDGSILVAAVWREFTVWEARTGDRTAVPFRLRKPVAASESPRTGRRCSRSAARSC